MATEAKAEDAEDPEAATVVGVVMVPAAVAPVVVVEAVERAEPEVEDSSSRVRQLQPRRTHLPVTATGRHSSLNRPKTTTPKSASFAPTRSHTTLLRLAAIRHAISAPCG